VQPLEVFYRFGGPVRLHAARLCYDLARQSLPAGPPLLSLLAIEVTNRLNSLVELLLMEHEQLAELGVPSVLDFETAASTTMTWRASTLAIIDATETPLGVPLTVALALSERNERATTLLDTPSACPAEP